MFPKPCLPYRKHAQKLFSDVMENRAATEIYKIICVAEMLSLQLWSHACTFDKMT